MSLKKQIIEDLKQAMKSGDTMKRDTLRMLDSMIKNVEIEKKKREEGLADKEVEQVISRAIKQRKDATAQFKAGGRPELAEKEEKEANILLSYMPEQMSEDELRRQIKAVINETGAIGKSDMGRVMGAAMKSLKGRSDGQTVKKIVEEELG
jgi:hypothetical protein